MDSRPGPEVGAVRHLSNCPGLVAPAYIESMKEGHWLKPEDSDKASEILEDWQYWVFAGSYRLADMGLSDT